MKNNDILLVIGILAAAYLLQKAINAPAANAGTVSPTANALKYVYGGRCKQAECSAKCAKFDMEGRCEQGMCGCIGVPDDRIRNPRR